MIVESIVAGITIAFVSSLLLAKYIYDQETKIDKELEEYERLKDPDYIKKKNAEVDIKNKRMLLQYKYDQLQNELSFWKNRSVNTFNYIERELANKNIRDISEKLLHIND